MTDCLECRAGRHTDCDTTTWDDEGEPVACACWRANHDVRPPEVEAEWLDDDPFQTGRAEDRYLRWLSGGDR